VYNNSKYLVIDQLHAAPSFNQIIAIYDHKLNVSFKISGSYMNFALLANDEGFFLWERHVLKWKSIWWHL